MAYFYLDLNKYPLLYASTQSGCSVPICSPCLLPLSTQQFFYVPSGSHFSPSFMSNRQMLWGWPENQIVLTTSTAMAWSPNSIHYWVTAILYLLRGPWILLFFTVYILSIHTSHNWLLENPFCLTWRGSLHSGTCGPTCPCLVSLPSSHPLVLSHMLQLLWLVGHTSSWVASHTQGLSSTYLHPDTCQVLLFFSSIARWTYQWCHHDQFQITVFPNPYLFLVSKSFQCRLWSGLVSHWNPVFRGWPAGALVCKCIWGMGEVSLKTFGFFIHYLSEICSTDLYFGSQFRPVS